MTRLARFSAAGHEAFGLIEDGVVRPLIGPPYGGVRLDDSPPLPLECVRLLAPVAPSKIVCFGLTFVEHANEVGLVASDVPPLFLKSPSAVVGPGMPIRLPGAWSSDVHHEGELAVVVGRELCNASERTAEAGILGYTAANDVTARDLQRHDNQWARAKSFDTFCPLGPTIETRLEANEVRIRCSVDGELRQDGTTADLLYPIHALVAYASHLMTLHPGDVLLMGSPAGSGPLQAGQTVTVEITSIGRLVNPVVGSPHTLSEGGVAPSSHHFRMARPSVGNV